MQNGQYITDRWMVRMVRDVAHAQGITFRSFSDDWLIELQKGERIGRILGYKFDLNMAVPSGIAQDKVATYQLLTSQNISAVPHFLVRTKAGEKPWKDLDWEEGVVLKPLTGTSGHGVGLYHDSQQAQHAIKGSGIEAWAASPYRDIMREIRVIILGQKILLAYEKRPVEHGGMKFFNLGKGACPLPYLLTEATAILAQSATASLGLRLAAVDIIESPKGEYSILEVNDGMMMENYARFSAENKAVAEKVYAEIINAMFAS